MNDLLSKQDRDSMIKEAIRSEAGWQALILAIHNNYDAVTYCLNLFDEITENKFLSEKIKGELQKRLNDYELSYQANSSINLKSVADKEEGHTFDKSVGI